MKIIKSLILLVTLTSFLFAGVVIIEWKAEPESGKIVLRWKTSQENNVQKFVIERSSDNKHFTDIGEISPRGPGFQYKFEDDNLGRMASLFYYRLRIVNNDGTANYTDSLPVIPNISSIQRTWGSIKALFR